jgi:hypothetical protein
MRSFSGKLPSKNVIAGEMPDTIKSKDIKSVVQAIAEAARRRGIGAKHKKRP